MRKPNRKRSGFTLIEVIAATVLLVITASGFMAMTATNVKLLAKENRIERSNYELSAQACSGQGEPAGETLTVIFNADDGRSKDVEEIFEKYSVSEAWEDMENSMDFYRHGSR